VDPARGESRRSSCREDKSIPAVPLTIPSRLKRNAQIRRHPTSPRPSYAVRHPGLIPSRGKRGPLHTAATDRQAVDRGWRPAFPRPRVPASPRPRVPASPRGRWLRCTVKEPAPSPLHSHDRVRLLVHLLDGEARRELLEHIEGSTAVYLQQRRARPGRAPVAHRDQVVPGGAALTMGAFLTVDSEGEVTGPTAVRLGHISQLKSNVTQVT
jgi:hypothetical protein